MSYIFVALLSFWCGMIARDWIRDVPVEYDEDGNPFVSLDKTEVEFLRDKLNEYMPPKDSPNV